MNGESLGDKREALRREKGRLGSGGKRRKIREKKEEVLEGKLKEKEEKWGFKLERT